MNYFVEVVNHGGMTNASKALYIAQPTISKAIKDLENELSMPLFDRSKRQIVLTDAGEIFYKKSKEILALYNNLPTEINSLLGLEFHQLYPNVTYNMVENGGKMIEAQLFNDEIDIGITTIPVDSTIFNSIPLYQEDLKLVLNSEHRLANNSTVSMSELKEEDFILFNEDFYLNDKIRETAKNAGFIPKTISKISQWNFIDNLLNAHLGVSILPESIVQMLDSDFKSIKFDDPSINLTV